MKKLLAAVAALALGLGAMVAVNDALARPPWEDSVVRPFPPCQNQLVKAKQAIAVKLCVAMARSGAYADLDDNQFSDFCIKVASHLGDSQYDHTDAE